MRLGAEAALREGDPERALAELQEAVRSTPADARLRVFLFQLLCVVGQWERALTQLELCAQMDAAALPMRETYRDAIRCELLRAEVFKGRRTPMLFGEPEGWIAKLIESLVRSGRGEADAASQLRDEAFDEAPTSAGSVNGQSFEWIADADSRLGPVLEAVVNGRYCWIPFSRLARAQVEEPTDLRDAVWLPANLTFANGGEAVALLPARYPGSEHAEDGLIALARKTVWHETRPGAHEGLGQRMLTTEAVDIPLLELRDLVIGRAADG